MPHLTGLLATTPVEPNPSPTYWLEYILAAVIIAILVAVLIALVPWIKHSGARDKAVDERVELLPLLKRIVLLALGDETVYPKVPGWGAQLETISRKLSRLTDVEEGRPSNPHG